MDDKDGKNPLVAISAMLALFTALGVIVYVQAPLKGIRPPMPAIEDRSQKIGARLWQDPFQAVLDQTKTKDGPKPAALCVFKEPISMETGPLVKEINDHLDKGEKITVLGVMVFGAPYEEEMENRLRKRYAALSGLVSSGFIADDPEHLGYVRIFQSQQECQEAGNQPSLSTILPFEWFISEDQKQAVLLLWINDDVFKNNPLEKLAILITQLRSQTKEAQLAFKLIGPAGSTTLLEMLREIQKGLKSKKATTAGAPGNLTFLPQLRGLTIYSAMATAENSILDQELKNATGSGLNLVAEDPVAAKFSECGITFQRTIKSDKELAEALVEELKLRGVEPPDHIALISEWDTFYGRSLPKSFEKAWKAKYGDKDKETRILQFSYLRGIDGQLPGDRAAAPKGGPKNDTNPKEGNDIQKMEEPTGKSQYDYLRRLAGRIYLLDQQLERQQKGQIKAIGVLGSDFYDKYLVLQALGQWFPERIFFTTDLDARLFHPAAIEWTRNLVVASGFGLQLRHNVQGTLPPFRDVYQTSVYLAIRQAFNHPPYDFLQESGTPKPRIFEIGRLGAIDLTTGKPEPNTVHPPRDLGGLAGNKFIVVLSIILLLLLIVWFMSMRVQIELKRWMEFFSRNPEIALLALLSLVLIIILFDKFDKTILQNPSEEPFSLFEGVSIWPTAILRLAAAVLSLSFFVTSVSRLRRSDRRLAQEFFGLDSDPAKPARLTPHPYLHNLQSWWPARVAQYQMLRDWLGRKHEPLSGDEQTIHAAFPRGVEKVKQYCQEIRRDWAVDQDQVRVKEVWEEYVRRGSMWFRLERIIPLLIIYLVVCGLIIGFFGQPTTPVRGDISQYFNLRILLAAIISFLFLSFFVFDATSHCRRFVTLFLGKEPLWGPRLLARFRGRVGLEDAELGDWMLIQLIARDTEVVGRLIFYPFIVWFVIFLSRMRYFDNWRTPIGLAIVISMSAVLAWSCAFMLRRTAESIRTDVLERLSRKIHAAKPRDQEHQESVQRLFEEVKGMRMGAFAPYYQNPLVQSLLVPLGGISGVSLLEVLWKLT
jgi:hypothetical protein